MRAEHLWGSLWFFLFPIFLTAVSQTFLPHTPPLQLLILPVWAVYWMLSRPLKQGFWISGWHALLCEVYWSLPSGTCITFFLLIWWLIRSYRELLPTRPNPYHGLLCGVILLPALRSWIWLYALLWPTLEDAGPLYPSLVEIITIPAAGALGGSAIFALAAKTEFLIFKPNPKELRADAR